MDSRLDELHSLYQDTERCAESIGLIYVSDASPGLSRQRSGKGFSFIDASGRRITDANLKSRIKELAIPPAWKGVWICPKASGHILATGVDDKGRKQYIYNPKWRTMRDLLNFYRLLSFGARLPAIRQHIETQLNRRTLDRDKVLAVMLWVLDHAYIRVGNETYYEQNESVGLSTLAREHVVISGDDVTLAFTGKSSQEHEITFSDRRIAKALAELQSQKSNWLFTANGEHIGADSVNELLQSLAGKEVHAKDFRTWGGTLAAFTHLKREVQNDTDKKPEKAVIEAIDQAADALGNTRTVAKSHYVHPHILQSYVKDDFATYYQRMKPRKRRYMSEDETELVRFLELLFEEEFKKIKLPT